MSIDNRFFGKREPDDAPDDLIAHPMVEGFPSLQVLFADPGTPDAAEVTRAMREYHPSMSKGRCEIAPDAEGEGSVIGLAGWGNHVVKFIGFDLPMPRDAVEGCVAPSHYGRALKEKAFAHRGHVLLWYAGGEESVLEQFVALAAFAGALAGTGAIVVLNEGAHTSFPAEALAKNADWDMYEQLRSLPLPLLYCGFVKYNVPDDSAVWMRTYGAHVLGIPDLAAYAAGHHEGELYFELFGNILRSMLESGALLEPGNTMQVGADQFLRCRAPEANEDWLASEGDILVTEIAGPNGEHS